MTTPVPRILLALEGKMDFVIKTNPWGSKKKDEKPKSKAARARLLAAELSAFATSHNARNEKE